MLGKVGVGKLSMSMSSDGLKVVMVPCWIGSAWRAPRGVASALERGKV
jgi:hypothetical protein